MAGKKKGRQPLLDFLNKVVDEGTTEEIDMQKIGHKLFGRGLNLTGKVKLHMEPFKKTGGSSEVTIMPKERESPSLALTGELMHKGARAGLQKDFRIDIDEIEIEFDGQTPRLTGRIEINLEAPDEA